MSNIFKQLRSVIFATRHITNKDIRVRGHCHITSSYRGAVHQDCNLKLRINPKEFKIPVIFHKGRTIRKVMGEGGEFLSRGNFFRYQIPCMNFLGRGMNIF